MAECPVMISVRGISKQYVRGQESARSFHGGLAALGRLLRHETIGPPDAKSDTFWALDDVSFDGFWRLGPVGLKDAIEATPSSRFRVGRDADRIIAYAITGIAGRYGYLQRVAVHPTVR